MKFTQNLFYLLVSSLIVISCNKEPIPKDMREDSLIPLPSSVKASGLSFELTKSTKIFTDDEKLGQYTAEVIKSQTGLSLKVLPQSSNPQNGNIYMMIDSEGEKDPEAYNLSITPDNINLVGQSGHGLFNGIQTLRQLVPINGATPILLSSGEIKDSPRFGHRGAMLDVSRHFFPVEDVFRFIDLIASYKINVLHLHLSDDQGWRIEIKSWPKLTEIGGSTEVGGGKGGFYTQEDYKDIVKYAADRFITIIPEIDMPGHTNAALVAYPELNCNKKDPNPKLYTGMEVGFSTLCTDKEIVYDFVDDVIREISEMTPGEYFHIGGDESHVTDMKDYIPFINRVQKIVKKHGKKPMGWDEIAHAKLDKDAVVHYWAREKNALKGIGQGAKVLMSPATKTYLDMQYDSTTHIGLHWAAYIELDSSYLWDPATLSPFIKDEHILGVESPLWSETVTTMDEIEYMAFPRILSHSEIGWSPQNRRNWEDFKVRLGNQKPRLKAMEIDFYESKQIPWTELKN